jgi:hypothetical protein
MGQLARHVVRLGIPARAADAHATAAAQDEHVVEPGERRGKLLERLEVADDHDATPCFERSASAWRSAR